MDALDGRGAHLLYRAVEMDNTAVTRMLVRELRAGRLHVPPRTALPDLPSMLELACRFNFARVELLRLVLSLDEGLTGPHGQLDDKGKSCLVHLVLARKVDMIHTLVETHHPSLDGTGSWASIRPSSVKASVLDDVLKGIRSFLPFRVSLLPVLPVSPLLTACNLAPLAPLPLLTLLIQHGGADVNQADVDHNTCLSLLLERKHVAGVQEVLRLGAAMNGKGRAGHALLQATRADLPCVHAVREEMQRRLQLAGSAAEFAQRAQEDAAVVGQALQVAERAGQLPVVAYLKESLSKESSAG